MKKTIIAFSILLVSCANVPADKRQHFIAGAISSGIVVTFTNSPKQGCIAAATVGIGKERYDSKTHAPDTKDAIATTLGCSIWYLIKD